MGNLIGFVWIFSKTNYMKALSPIDHFYLKKGANLGFSSNALKYAVKWLVWILEVKRRFFGQNSWVRRHEFFWYFQKLMGNLIGFVWIFAKTNYMKALSPIDHFYLKKGANLGFSSNALKYAVKWLVWILEVKRRFFGQNSWVGRHEFVFYIFTNWWATG